MNDILARYKQIEAKAHNTNANLELFNKEGNIILRMGASRQRLANCMFVYIIGFLIFFFFVLTSFSLPIKVSVGTAVVVLGLWSMVKSQFLEGYCGIYPESQEFRVQKQNSLRTYTLLLKDVICFVGVFYLNYSARGGPEPRRKLYVVSQDGKMHQIVLYDPADDLGKRMCEYLGFLCDKPVYLTEKEMPKAKFITGPPDDLVFHLDAFLQAKKEFYPTEAT